MRGGLLPWQLRAAIRFMEENLDSNFPLAAVAERTRLSCSYFSRGFRQSTGWAPHQWLIRARVARAQELLIDTIQPLADIALGVGFSDQAHFTRSFGKVVGSSPGAWRRAHARAA
jgi:AraC family transcriptional regulator